MASHKIKTGDDVIVLTGKDKGRTGRVLRIIDSKKVVVEGVAMIKKHMKPNPQQQQPGGIVEKEAPIQLSNVALYNPATKKGDRVGFKTLDDGRKVRFYKSNGEVIDI